MTAGVNHASHWPNADLSRGSFPKRKKISSGCFTKEATGNRRGAVYPVRSRINKVTACSQSRDGIGEFLISRDRMRVVVFPRLELQPHNTQSCHIVFLRRRLNAVKEAVMDANISFDNET